MARGVGCHMGAMDVQVSIPKLQDYLFLTSQTVFALPVCQRYSFKCCVVYFCYTSNIYLILYYFIPVVHLCAPVGPWLRAIIGDRCVSD